MSELRIAVLIKQVPDPSLVEISEEGRLIREGVPSVTDPFGAMALQHALSVRGEKHVDAVTMGPMQSGSILRKALEFGADGAYLLTGKEFAGADTFATAGALAAFIMKNDYDLVFCGMQATDGDTAQVPSELAVFLGCQIYPYATSVSDDTTQITQSSNGTETVSELIKPAVVAFMRPPESQTQIPSIKGYVDALDADIHTVGPDDIGLCPCRIGAEGSKTKVISVSTVMRKKKETVCIDGADSSSAAGIILKEVL